MVTTKRDGTKFKEYLDPEDPRIAEIGVTKRVRMPDVDNSTSGSAEPNFINATEQRSDEGLRTKSIQSNKKLPG